MWGYSYCARCKTAGLIIELKNKERKEGKANLVVIVAALVRLFYRVIAPIRLFHREYGSHAFYATLSFSLRISMAHSHCYCFLGPSYHCKMEYQCVCVCVYILPPWRLLPSARCSRHTWGYGSTILCCEY